MMFTMRMRLARVVRRGHRMAGMYGEAGHHALVINARAPPLWAPTQVVMTSSPRGAKTAPKQLSERRAFIPPSSTSAFLDGPVPLLPQLLRQREGQRGLHASRRALVHRRPLPRAAPPRVGRHGHARLHVRGGDSPELTRTRRGLLRARTGYACQPPAYCTYLRRRAACHQGRHCNALLGYPPRAYGAYRGPWHPR